ncbi:MAG: FHA domain-containing protein [Candidatus Latescibacteria bacterium]|nr:FHA domain-containing protein [Candidatus Latescibacterota bacterium]NIM66443.1 FHA domain-containing protein [Candidatus Latescibacterota bacterium]NIO02923.1 FHA domain-containing protein [Candidatus Latescibacterota bacterium]NIO30058.1 FHA domain-containing protein [Candidatus Latescibacterota bacterium]NIO57673.1 FHA domain-containing protein [Candidatus Latescibacterota bacterium]
MVVTLPHLHVASAINEFSPGKMNDIMFNCLKMSREKPCYLELSDGAEQRHLFFRQRQIYAAGRIQDMQFTNTTIKEFLLAASKMSFPQAKCYEVNDKILHSILILFQKKPALKTLTSLIDLDELLDKIESEGKSCIVCATQDDFLAILRYEKGKVTALCHQLSCTTPKESSYREDFLIKIYTLCAQKPMAITLYEDLLVTYAEDAKMIDESFHGDLISHYLSKPPFITLEFKGREIKRLVLDKPTVKIGRTQDNDIAIDNLAVSRLHSIIEEDKGNFYIKDCDSLNGTLLNGKRVGRAKLVEGDEIFIGKHKIIFHRQEGCVEPAGETIEQFDQTVVITPHKVPPKQSVAPKPEHVAPSLVQKTPDGDRVFELKRATVTIGKDFAADIEIGGFLVAKEHAEIARENGAFILRHLHGLRKVTVSGKPVREHVLKNNDVIRIGSEEFIFQE